MRNESGAENSKLELKCESFIPDERGKLISCENNGERRYDNKLYCGIHCGSCWEKLIYNARQRSY